MGKKYNCKNIEEMEKDLDGKIKVFKAITGSYNYNLNDENSDVDYKLFVMPSIPDIYTKKEFIKSYYIEESNIDISVHDIRRLPDLLSRSNSNFIEVLFSVNSILNPDFPEIQEIYNMKDSIARINLPFLYDSMYRNAERYKDEYVSKNNYKSAMSCIRMLTVIRYFGMNNFTGFHEALWCDDLFLRRRLLEIKHGEYNGYWNEKISLIDLINRNFEDVKEYESRYKDYEFNQKTKDKLDTLVKNMVLKHIKDNIKL